MLRRLAAFASLAFLAATGFGQLGYAQRTQNVRAAVLTLDATRYPAIVPGQGANDTPFVWLNVDSNRRVKPAGWNFYNPLAPGVVDANIATRWSAISALPSVGGAAPGAGSPIDKHTAAYWELRLSTASDEQMSQYDILLFSGQRFPVSLNSAEREKLRKYVDAGGILWIDLTPDIGPTAQPQNLDVPNNFPVPILDSHSGGAAPLTYADVFHPLLTTPNVLTLSNLESIATDGDINNIKALFFNTPGINKLDRLLMPLPEESQKMLPVAGNANGPAVAVARLGDGFIVVTTRGYANALNRVRLSNSTFDPNNRYEAASPSSDRISDTAAKLVINMVSLGSSFGQSQQGSRKQNSSLVGIGAPLLKRFDVKQASGRTSAVIYKGLLVVTTDKKVIVYDANPAADLDNDGNADDGLPDYALGAGYDEIWESAPLNGPLSPPICAEVPNANNKLPTDQIMVVDASGALNVFDAFPTDPTGRLLGPNPVMPVYTLSAPTTGGTFVSTGIPNAPTFQENVVTIADTIQSGFGNNSGRVWLVDARSGVLMTTGAAFTVGNGILPEISASPLVGYIPIADNSGGVDRVIYVAGKPGNSGAFPTASVTSIWLGAKGEVPPTGSVTATPTLLVIQTRAFRQGLPIYVPATGAFPAANQGSGLGVKLTIIDANGDPWDATKLATYFDNTLTQPAVSSGQLEYGLKIPLPLKADGTLDVGVRVDYTIDWGNVNPALATQLVRGSINFPDDVTRGFAVRRSILGNLALSPRGTLSAVVSTGDNSSASSSGGSFYELREEGRGAFRVIVRYDLYPQHTFALSGSSPVTIPTTLDDNDPLAKLAAPTWLDGSFQQLTFTGGPTVRNGVVYVTARGMKITGNTFQRVVPFALLMAFRAEPDNPSIKVGAFPDGSTIVQPDITQTAGGQKSAPNRYNSLQNGGTSNQFTYDSETGTVYINNLANVNRGQISSALSLSQPIIIKSPNGAADRWFWPDATGSNWSPLLWYTVQHGTGNLSAPFVAGNTLYMAGTTALPYFVTNPNPAGVIPKNNGVGFAMDATISATDPFIVPNTGGRSWISQVTRLRVTGADGYGPIVQANPDMRWPQSVGNQSYDTFVQRLLQTEIGSTTTGFADSGVGVIGGDRALVLIGQIGTGITVYSSFSRSDVVVADQGRVVRFDPSGNPIWSTDTSLATSETDTGTASTIKGLVRPTRAYLYGDTDVLVVDPGTSKILRLDSSGRQIRTIAGFQIDSNYVPDGFQSNEKLTFDSPSDVATFGEFVPGPRLAANPMSNPQPLEYWYHYVVADTGNHRLVDVVDRYAADPVTRRILAPVALGVLVWHTPAILSGKKFEYTSVTRIVPSSVGGSNYYYVAGLGNALPTRVDTGLDTPTGLTKLRQADDGNGGIVVFDPSNATPPNVINEVQVPIIAQNAFWNDSTGTFSSTAQPAHAKHLSSLTSVTARNMGNTTAIMFTDATGVYEIVPGGGGWTVRWMLPNEAYRVMRGVYNLYDNTTLRGASFAGPGAPLSRNPADFRATYARRLDSGEVLIVNGYAGTTRGDLQANGSFLNRLSYGGEVVQVDGDVNDDVNNPVDPLNPNKFPGFSFLKTNLGFGYLSIKFELPPVSGARALLQPIFADRR